MQVRVPDVTPAVPSSLSQGSPKTGTDAGTRDGWRDGNECEVKMRKSRQDRTMSVRHTDIL